MRATRFGSIAQKKSSGYVWEIYNLAYGLDESSATTGTVTISSTRTRRASNTYTASSSGFTLTNSKSTATTGLAGKYIVSISTSSNTSTTGEYIYYVDSVSASGTSRTVSYTRYSVGAQKGTTKIGQVASDTLDYPANGLYNGSWYVLVSGPVLYTWDVYNVTFVLGNETTVDITPIGVNISYRYGTGYTIDSATQISLTGVGSTRFSNLEVGQYLTTDSANGGGNTSAEYIYKILRITVSDYVQDYIKTYRYNAVGKRGTSTGQTVQSYDVGAYPANGEQNGLWYILR